MFKLRRLFGEFDMELRKPYALFLGDAPDRLAAKVAIGVAEWRPEQCVGQVRLPDCKPRLDLPDMSIDEAAEAGAQTLVIGERCRMTEVWWRSRHRTETCTVLSRPAPLFTSLDHEQVRRQLTFYCVAAAWVANATTWLVTRCSLPLMLGRL